MQHRRATRPSSAVLLWAAVVLLVIALMAPTAASASSVPLVCGQTITRDTTVRADLGPCPGDGLVIGADNITLDLGGHALIGVDGAAGDETGVDFAGHDRVTVRNGTIRSFFVHVQLGQPGAPVRRATVLGVRFFDGSFATDGDADRSLIAFNTSAPTGPPLTMLGGDFQVAGNRNVVAANSALATAIGVAGAGNYLVANHANNLAIGPRGRGTVVVTGNTVQTLSVFGGSGRAHRPSSIVVHNASVPTQSPHAFSQGGIIVWGGATDVVVRGNRVTSPASSPAGARNGITILDGTRHLVVDNLVAGASENGIFVQGPTFAPPPLPPVLLSPGATNTVLRNNVTRRNGHDGILNNAPTTTLVGNEANDNVFLGIESVAGVVDGGGNRARGNGNPLQCTNVVCSWAVARNTL